jgi:flagellar hook-associated protein 1
VSTFSGLNTATTALWAQQRALDITGQNVANVNTEGYSRQRVSLQSVGGSAVPAVYAVNKNIGEGVNADAVSRIRDAFLESRAQTESASTASLTVADNTLSQVEDAFREPGSTGIQAQLSNMWNAWASVHNNSTDPGARTAVLQSTQTLVSGLHQTRQTLDQQWDQNHDTLTTLVEDVNSSAKSIADLNVAIRRATQSGLPTSELQDKRDVLVQKLAQQIGATSAPADEGGITVAVGGATLVSGGSTLGLKLVGSTDPDDAASDPPRIVTSPGNSLVRTAGTADGQLTAMTTTIPAYRTQLDAIAQQLATDLNAAHAAGFDENGDPGEPLLDDGSGALPVDDGTGKLTLDTSTITAANIQLRISDPRKLAAASLSTGDTGGVASADNGNADAIYQLSLKNDGTDATYRKMIVALGVQASTASDRLASQSAISTQIDASRESVSGVNLDEEMTNMLQYQHAYAAAGKLVSVINDTLDTLINMVR